MTQAIKKEHSSPELRALFAKKTSNNVILPVPMIRIQYNFTDKITFALFTAYA